ncbi:hypothetical protein OCU04_006782 [Sclerotinia nivalis]|uniref:Uncharacterized protein n=1 Tax=Sclerotinia nivalis TaxID=352851 RepID=A0A9X0DIS4_9HELO|nr:hypothetical protein OCU04_006782 [Sclerotinia nivalis]
MLSTIIHEPNSCLQRQIFTSLNPTLRRFSVVLYRLRDPLQYPYSPGPRFCGLPLSPEAT